MRYLPKHLQPRRHRKTKAIISTTLIGIATCATFLNYTYVPVVGEVDEVDEVICSAAITTPSEDVPVYIAPKATPTPEPKPLYTEEDLTAITLTLAGECYDDEIQDKYNVAWTIINRVRNGNFGGNTVLQVVSCTLYGVQFVGYWTQSRPVSDNDYVVAKEVLTAFYAGKPAPVDYLYFHSGGTTNIFS